MAPNPAPQQTRQGLREQVIHFFRPTERHSTRAAIATLVPNLAKTAADELVSGTRRALARTFRNNALLGPAQPTARGGPIHLASLGDDVDMDRMTWQRSRNLAETLNDRTFTNVPSLMKAQDTERGPGPPLPLPPHTSRITLRDHNVSIQQGSKPVVAVKSWRESYRPFGRQAIPILDGFASIAEGVPVLGSVVKGPIDATVKLLKGLERCCQNKDDVQQVSRKLGQLQTRLEKYPATSENTQWLIRALDSIKSDLEELSAAHPLDYQSVSEGIVQCDKDISYVLECFSALGHLDTQSLVNKGHDEMRQMREQIAALQLTVEVLSKKWEILKLGGCTTIPPSISIVIRVVDPFGVKHYFPEVPNSYEVLGKELLDRYPNDAVRKSILKLYLDHNLFELSRNEDHQFTLITEQDLSSLESNSTVILSIVAYVEQTLGRVQCPLCKNFILVSDKNTKRVECRTCDKNVQVTFETTEEGEVDDASRVELVEEHLAQLQQIVVKLGQNHVPEASGRPADNTGFFFRNSTVDHNDFDPEEARRVEAAIRAEIRAAMKALPNGVRFTDANALIITDALGETMHVPWSIVPSYEDLHRMLVNHFRWKIGERRVAERRYCVVRAGGAMGGALVTANDWDSIRKNREHLVMCMLIERAFGPGLRKMCPKCGETLLGTYEDQGWQVCRICNARFVLPQAGPPEGRERRVDRNESEEEGCFRHIRVQWVSP